MNRLKNEKSPYLHMHSQNPVDWYPWGEEAFSDAQTQDKPIFLSIGYSSCHWCHVIARESFEDPEIAELLNARFVSVKVDKEERPDVDAVYMDAVQLATGAGGWPMSLLLTPQGEPFFAATYLPRTQLKQILLQADRVWREERESVRDAARMLTEKMRNMAQYQPPVAQPTPALTNRALAEYVGAYDAKWGGFGGAPKFPTAHNLLFLLAYARRTGDQDAQGMAEGTLDALLRGGIFDHIGGGLCRYSVDRRWLTPHFEKMLYDNALLIWACAEAWRATREARYRRAVERVVGYVLREMTGGEGQFFCAQDADSEGREGAYYLFTRKELLTLLGNANGARFCQYYNITDEGDGEGWNIPNRIGREEGEADDTIETMRERVYAYRRARMPLRRDDKVLTAWNALMIAALVAAYESMDEPAYLTAAWRAEQFLAHKLTAPDGTLFLRFREGEAKGQGVLSDYACYAMALTMLFRATGEHSYLQRAEELATHMVNRFGDGEKAGFYLYAEGADHLITRPKDVWEGALPSGNAYAGLALLHLAEYTDAPRWRGEAESQLCFLAGVSAEAPVGQGFSLYAIEHALVRGRSTGCDIP